MREREEEAEDTARALLFAVEHDGPRSLMMDCKGARRLLGAAEGFALIVETEAANRYAASSASALADDVHAVALELLRRLRLPEADAGRFADDAARAVRRLNAPPDALAAVVGPTMLRALRLAARLLRAEARPLLRALRPAPRARSRRARPARPPARRVRAARPRAASRRPRSSSPRPRAARRTVSTPRASAASPPQPSPTDGPSGTSAPRTGERGRP